MADHHITGEEWAKCEEALMSLTGGVNVFLNLENANAHGDRALYFLAHSMRREIDTLKDLLGYAESDPRFPIYDVKCIGEAHV
jgi:hypothetical protein